MDFAVDRYTGAHVGMVGLNGTRTRGSDQGVFFNECCRFMGVKGACRLKEA